MTTANIHQNIPLGPHTTIGIGGLADYLTEVESVEGLKGALTWAAERGIPTLILGGGSNMVVSDNGWKGLVVKVGILGIVRAPDEGAGRVRVICGGGESWDDLVKYAVDGDLQGIECLSGIPGTVGASPIQNIGAYGQEVKETIAWVEVVDRSTGNIVRFTNAECQFDYRWSRFKGIDKDRYVVTYVAFDLQPGGLPVLRYGDLTRYFDNHKIASPGLSDVRQAVLDVRRSKGMVVDPEIPDSRSCGSFFMNPIVSNEIAADVKAMAEQKKLMREGETMPEFAAGDGQVKLSAAWLMERAGLNKGLKMGEVGLSSRHVLALINCGAGTSAELEVLVRHVQDRVRQTFGIDLHPEPVFVGFESRDIVPAGKGASL